VKRFNKWINDSGEPLDIHDLDEKIMANFTTADDLEILISRVESLNEDQLINALIGLHIFCAMRADEIKDCYERVLHNMREDHTHGNGDVTDSVHERNTERGSSRSNSNTKPDSLLPEGL